MEIPNTTPPDANDWHIPETSTEVPQRFDFEASYSPSDFLIILRLLINQLFQLEEHESVLFALEIWEKRAIELQAQTESDSGYQPRISFVRGSDGVVRMNIQLAV